MLTSHYTIIYFLTLQKKNIRFDLDDEFIMPEYVSITT